MTTLRNQMRSTGVPSREPTSHRPAGGRDLGSRPSSTVCLRPPQPMDTVGHLSMMPTVSSMSGKGGAKRSGQVPEVHLTEDTTVQELGTNHRKSNL